MSFRSNDDDAVSRNAHGRSLCPVENEIGLMDLFRPCGDLHCRSPVRTAPVAGPADHSARESTRMLSVLQNTDAVDQHVTHTCSELMRLIVSRVIGNLGRIENDDVAEVARLQQPATPQPQVSSRQTGHLVGPPSRDQ